MTNPTPPADPAGPAPAPTQPQQQTTTTPTFTPPGGDPSATPSSTSQPGQQSSQSQQPAGTSNQQQPGQPAQGGDQRPPWERDGTPFDPQRAWELLQKTRGERDDARGQRDQHKTALDEIERGKLTAQQQAEADRDSFKSRAEAAEWELARHAVIAGKGLQPAAAEFLTGSTREELEASADRLLAWNPGAALASPPATPPPGPVGPAGRPAEALTVPPGGSDPASQLTGDDLDPAKLAARIPRGIR